ncbi:AraC family transcriptional regulator [Pseudomonas benzenivorans]|uniref:AraC family transcriptional regulator n=1 Tax=Pseudomonas benzenivorans TaxID=556533 RepID=A0ABZ0PUY1_9PSED|nr:AraC family transcriptional regulator [Pseudomonas benzenivorans]WPC04992.1 AraC family transcriptional regulator [Pseudomonas benzenivorans]
MKEKIVGPQRVLCIGRELSIPEIAAQAQACCAEITRVAEARGLKVAGPWVFVSHKLPSNASERFRIAFCLPVEGTLDEPAGAVESRELAAMRCVHGDYHGPLAGIFAQGYAPLVEGALAAGHRLTGESREVYHRWQGADSPDNRIELQFGIG